MNRISQLFLGLVLVSTGAFASDLAPVLKSLNVTEIGNHGKVVKSHHQHPYSTFLIAIPAKVAEESACTKFVGQTTTAAKGPKASALITAVGATDPGIDACIQIYPMPVDTNLTVEMKVLTGGFVPAKPRQAMVVEIAGAGSYLVELDMSSERVKIRSVKAK